jgi:hypothetical protein
MNSPYGGTRNGWRRGRIAASAGPEVWPTGEWLERRDRGLELEPRQAAGRWRSVWTAGEHPDAEAVDALQMGDEEA